MMGEVQNLSSSECYIPSSEAFKFQKANGLGSVSDKFVW
jgi:hypothetical protein